MKKQYIMPAMQETQVSLKSGVMSTPGGSGNPTGEQGGMAAPTRLYC